MMPSKELKQQQQDYAIFHRAWNFYDRIYAENSTTVNVTILTMINNVAFITQLLSIALVPVNNSKNVITKFN